MLGALLILGLGWMGVRLFGSHGNPVQTGVQGPGNASLPQAVPMPAQVPADSSARSASSTGGADPTAPAGRVHEEIPDVPQDARRTIRGHIKVWVRVIIEQDGSVFGALADRAGPSRYFERLAIEAAKKNPHLRCISFDLPPVEPIAQKHIAAAGLRDRITTASGDFFKDPLPKADIITMGMILHDWNLEKKMQLIRAAYDALPPGGAFVALEALIDDARRENVFALLMSLNMLIEFGDAFDYSGADFRGWCSEVGFQRFEVIHLSGPSSAAVAYK